eukprot:GHVP01003885.1.p2 GENE.GHVP01003885.1~~GHVP01003885.1.p2  ORF type:complete len:114 (-),score=12.90 GHVP01003885.1:397-738(-)
MLKNFFSALFSAFFSALGKIFLLYELFEDPGSGVVSIILAALSAGSWPGLILVPLAGSFLYKKLFPRSNKCYSEDEERRPVTTARILTYFADGRFSGLQIRSRERITTAKVWC